jgi:glycosyltransferase involved in cell wall biosynthesis
MKKPSILMINENYYPGDSRVYKEVAALRDEYDITIICLKKKSEKCIEVMDGITILRIPKLGKIDFEKDLGIYRLYQKIYYIWHYMYFTLCSVIAFLITHPLKRYKVIHAHNPPDTLFLVGIIGKMLAVKFVFDHHDLSPELYSSRFSGKNDVLFSLLLLLERCSCRLADLLVSTNKSYSKIVMQRHGIDQRKIRIVRNDPIMAEYGHSESRESEVDYQKEHRVILLYLGSINPQDGLDVLVRALSHLRYDLNKEDFVCCIVGDGDSLPSVKRAVSEMELWPVIEFKGFEEDREEVIRYLASADICLEPAPENDLNKHSTFIKVLEYMAAGKPIVAFDLSETRFSTNGCALLVPSGDVFGFAKAIRDLMEDSVLRIDLGQKGHMRAASELNWEKSSQALRGGYGSLLGG